MKLDAIIAAAARVQREWGDYGYSVERAEHGPSWGACTLHVVCSDGGRFTVAADRYGNPLETESDRESARDLAAMRARYA